MILSVRSHGYNHIWDTDQTCSSVPCLEIKPSFCQNETTVWLFWTLASSCTGLPIATECGSNSCEVWSCVCWQSQLSANTEFQNSPSSITMFLNPVWPEIRIWSFMIEQMTSDLGSKLEFAFGLLAETFPGHCCSSQTGLFLSCFAV